MVDAADLKATAWAAIDAAAEQITAFARDIEAHPELGFKETRTTERVIAEFEALDLAVETPLAVTGARATDGDPTDFTIAVLGELDALINPDHPKADATTGAVHACGHHAQLAQLVGAAIGLSGTGLIDALGGTVEYVAVPAEEYLDLSFRRELHTAGQIEFFGGKQELIRRGHTDHWDAAMMMHAGSDTPERVVTSDFSTNGFIGKFVTYHGEEAHAGAAPEEGVNALNAAMLGLSAVHANRETFADEDHVRVHPIMTAGGEGVNVVPATARLESYVRARNVEAITRANAATNRALTAGAMGVGATVTIEDHPGYMPLRSDATMVAAYDANVRELLGEEAVQPGGTHLSGSTDMGDITQVVAGIHPWTGGYRGAIHARDFEVVDEEMALLMPAKLTAATVIDILTDPDAQQAITDANAEKLDRSVYLDQLQGMRSVVERSYADD
jgi:amidohydrolase